MLVPDYGNEVNTRSLRNIPYFSVVEPSGVLFPSHKGGTFLVVEGNISWYEGNKV